MTKKRAILHSVPLGVPADVVQSRSVVGAANGARTRAHHVHADSQQARGQSSRSCESVEMSEGARAPLGYGPEVTDLE